MAEMVDNMEISTPRGSLSDFSYRVTPYSGGSDHMMFIDRKIPAVMFSHTDYTHHTSEDTPDKVDPVELERCEIISLGTMWYFANLTTPQAAELAYLVERRVSGELADAARISERGAHEWSADAPIALIVSKADGIKAIESIGSFISTKEIASQMAAHTQRIDQAYNLFQKSIDVSYLMRISDLRKIDTRIPLRFTRGPLDFRLPESKLDSAGAAWYHSKEFTLDGDMRFELVNFIDGKRSVTGIRDALTAEFKPVDQTVVSHYLNDLVKVGVIRWK
jgi:hypothetical protein